ncbi:glycosyltransferase [Fibrobacterota bacterium]
MDKSPFKLNLMAPINDLGYGVHARGIIKGLAELGHEDYHLSCIGPRSGELSPEELALTERLMSHSRDPSAPCVKLWHEFQMDDLNGEKLIAYPVWETTRLVPEAITALKKMDAVLVATQWGKRIMHENIGADMPVYVVNEAGQELPDTLHEKFPMFTFLHVGKYEYRKCTPYIIKIYAEMFCDQAEETRLIAHCYNPFDANFELNIKTVLSHLGLEPVPGAPDKNKITARKGRAVVEIPLTRLTRSRLHELYMRSHAGLYPSCGEGWNLDLFESIVRGMPCVASFVSGHTEYTTEELGYPQDLLLFKGREALADDGKWFKGDKGNWVIPDTGEFKEKIFHVYRNYDEIIRNFDPRKIRERFTWKNSARQFLGALEDITGHSGCDRSLHTPISSPQIDVASSDGDFGFNVIGFITGNLSHGISARTTLEILEQKKIPFSAVNLDPGAGRDGYDTRFLKYQPDLSKPLPYNVNIFHVNPPVISQALALNHPVLEDYRKKMNICIPFSELPEFPPSWMEYIKKMDLVLSPSRFVTDGITAREKGFPCIYYRQRILKAVEAAPDRKKWGLPDDAVIFIFCFDMSSDIFRKNPLAIIQAFLTAFREDKSAMLVLKINNSQTASSYVEIADKIQHFCRSNPSIKVIDEILSHDEIMSLLASADAYVSLHRSEGLGLGLMESMFLGKPVIATAWSGNMDFMNEHTACLVGYRMVPIEPYSAYYRLCEGESQCWADPLQEDAVNWMRKLARDKSLRESIGERAKIHIRNYVDEADKGTAFDKAKDFYHDWLEKRRA